MSFTSTAAPTTQVTHIYCPRCSGRAVFPQFAHVKAGLCFQCQGAGAVEVRADPHLEARADAKAAQYSFKYEAGEWWIVRNTVTGNSYRVSEVACGCPHATYRGRCLHQVLLSRNITRLEQEAEEAETDREIEASRRDWQAAEDEAAAQREADAAQAAFEANIEESERLGGAYREAERVAVARARVATNMANDYPAED